jgi:hypothetical protein
MGTQNDMVKVEFLQNFARELGGATRELQEMGFDGLAVATAEVMRQILSAKRQIELADRGGA